MSSLDRVADLVMEMADAAQQVRAAYARVERAWRNRNQKMTAEQLWAIRRYKEDGHADMNGILRSQAPPRMPLYSVLRWQRGPADEAQYEDAGSLYCEAAPRRIRDLRRMALRAERNIVLATRSLLSSFDGAPRLPSGTVLFRGVKSASGLGDLKGKRKPTELTASGLWSSSVDPRVSRSFAEAADDDGQGGSAGHAILIVMRVAEGADVPFILVTDVALGHGWHEGSYASSSSSSYYYGEREVLLPHGLRLRVLRTKSMPDIDSSRGVGSEMTVVYAEAVGTSSATSVPPATREDPPEVTIAPWSMRVMDGCIASDESDAR